MIRLLALAVSLLASCGPARPGAGGRARLVVVVVLDQVGGWILDRHAPLLDPRGLTGRVRREGVWLHRVRYGYAATSTAPGHASIASGRFPREHGVVANRVWSAARKRAVAFLDDGVHAVLGGSKKFATPEVLRGPTVADALRERWGRRTKIAALSLKDRGAVLSGGRSPDVALWYDPTIQGFTTSRYYQERLPDWLVRWQRAHPLREWIVPWRPLEVAPLAALAGRDDAPGEGTWRSLGRTFPHDPWRDEHPEEAIVATPAATDMLLSLVDETVERLSLGADDVPDLLVVSVSTTDFVGHTWGPESWEAADDLVRTDLALARLVERLEARGPVSLLVTADHGAPPLPESGRFPGAKRVLEDELLRTADAAIDRALGPGDWVRGYWSAYVYLSDAALRQRDRAVPAAIAAIRALPGVGGAYDVAALRSAPEPAGAVDRSAWRSVCPDRGGDIFVFAGRGDVLGDGTPPPSGIDHGSPWPEDTDVPVLGLGPGTRRLSSRAVLDQRRVAASIAALLGIAPPAGAPADALPGFGRR